MDVAHPIRSVVPTLDGPVLEVLARTNRPLTGSALHRLAGVGSPSGVRLVLARLVRQGLVQAEEHASAVVYRANRDHLAWPAVAELAGLRRRLVERLREVIRAWVPGPVHASLYGSAARADGDADSDVDILLVRPEGVDEDELRWADQVDGLRNLVEVWTGNHGHVFQLNLERLAEHVRASDPLVEEWRRDGVKLVGDDLRVVLRRASLLGGRR